MSDEQKHINPWAAKLEQVPLPDSADAWKGMERLLNQHMPVPEKKKRRWIFFLLFLILGITAGIIFYIVNEQANTATLLKRGTAVAEVPSVSSATDSLSGVNRVPISTTYKGRVRETLSASGSSRFANPVSENSGVSSPQQKALRLSTSSNRSEIMPESGSNNSRRFRSAIQLTRKRTRTLRKLRTPNSILGRTTKRKKVPETMSLSLLSQSPVNSRSESVVIGRSGITPSSRPHKAPANSDSISSGRSNGFTDSSSLQGAAGAIRTVPSDRYRIDPVAELVNNDRIKIPKAVSVTIPTNTKGSEKQLEENKRGWTFGIGLNHYFVLHQNTPKTFDAGSISGTVGDYLPVPQTQYHFNNKLYAQAELQINAPQFAQNVVLEQNTYQRGNLLLNDTVYIRKLSYSNLPLSLHYSPVKKLFVGGGLQFSRLTNAIVLYQQSEKAFQSPLPDSGKVYKTEVKSIKHIDTLYNRLHTSEVRLLGEISYQVNRFTLGLRYNYALTDFVKVPITTNGGITQARNSSLQLYVRFRLLDKRRKFRPHLE